MERGSQGSQWPKPRILGRTKMCPNNTPFASTLGGIYISQDGAIKSIIPALASVIPLSESTAERPLVEYLWPRLGGASLHPAAGGSC
jgi:hypothetical protein